VYWATCKAGQNSGHNAQAQQKRAADFYLLSATFIGCPCLSHADWCCYFPMLCPFSRLQAYNPLAGGMLTGKHGTKKAEDGVAAGRFKVFLTKGGSISHVFLSGMPAPHTTCVCLFIAC